MSQPAHNNLPPNQPNILLVPEFDAATDAIYQDPAYALHTLSDRIIGYGSGDVVTADRSNTHLYPHENARFHALVTPDAQGRYRTPLGQILGAAQSSEINYVKAKLDAQGNPIMEPVLDDKGLHDVEPNGYGGYKHKYRAVTEPLQPGEEPPQPQPLLISDEAFDACLDLSNLYNKDEIPRREPQKIKDIKHVNLRDASVARGTQHSSKLDPRARAYHVLLGGDPLLAHIASQDPELTYTLEQLANYVVSGGCKGRLVIQGPNGPEAIPELHEDPVHRVAEIATRYGIR